jgi:hypothetical protein
LSLDELADDEKSNRSMEREAARLRLVTDRRLKRGPTPGWIVDLAGERGDPILEPDWQAQAIDRLDREARADCTCRCHGLRTSEELFGEARQVLDSDRSSTARDPGFSIGSKPTPE